MFLRSAVCGASGQKKACRRDGATAERLLTVYVACGHEPWEAVLWVGTAAKRLPMSAHRTLLERLAASSGSQRWKWSRSASVWLSVSRTGCSGHHRRFSPRSPPGLLVVVCCPLSTYVQGTRVRDILIKRGSRPYTDGSSPRATQGRSAGRPGAGPPPQPPRAAVPRSPRGVCSAVGPASVTPCAWPACVLSSSAPDRRPLGTGVVCPRTLRAQRAPSTGGAPSSA